MDVHYVFDCDGTLTPSRDKIDPTFKKFMTSFILDRRFVYIVTGSDKPKTIEQIGKQMFDLCTRVYNCQGNEVWKGDTLLKQNNIKYTDQLDSALRQILEESPFPLRTGKHTEKRSGLINFSVVGRGATMSERRLYIDHDQRTHEREKIRDTLQKQFDLYDFQIAGETGIDIIVKGRDKGQIVNDFHPETDFIYFFGDKTSPGGNDYPLVKRLNETQMGVSFKVKNYKEVWEYLKQQNSFTSVMGE